jgi:SPW repeat
MRFIPTRVHGMLDYASGLLLIVAPYLFGFADGTAAQYIPQALGAGILLMSLITDYEFSLAKLVPMPVHLGVDVAGGLLLAASPWLFGFADRVYWPHLILGLAEIGAGLMTRTAPDARTGAELRV